MIHACPYCGAADRGPDDVCRECRYDYRRDVLMQKTLIPAACGCSVVGNGTLPNPVKFVFCPLHAAATELLRAARRAITTLNTQRVVQAIGAREYNALCAAVGNAGKGGAS